KRRGRSRSRCRLRKDDFILVDIADGDDARKQSRLAIRDVEKDFTDEAAGAARRQIERRRREHERIRWQWRTWSQLAFEEGRDQRRQKGDGRWDCEDTGRAHGMQTTNPARV